MAKDRFELSPGKPNWVRAFTLEGIIEFEAGDTETANLLVEVLNAFVTDLLVDRFKSQGIAPKADWLYV